MMRSISPIEIAQDLMMRIVSTTMIFPQLREGLLDLHLNHKKLSHCKMVRHNVTLLEAISNLGPFRMFRNPRLVPAQMGTQKYLPSNAQLG
ncbi:hypothetical protein AVEN_220360-1 [Araneus ventricosus]|uniref:Uncharacterized protein n=1 Tax=Araneus ventricosus TaxID=182803 RepID=A0A4Y2V5V6_ARAVE|nr:hypothetical protein AVEN_220360-1 [Araneus ventricosus]